MFRNEPKQTIDVAYTKHEMLEKLQELRKAPEIVDRDKIYILTNHVNEFHALTRDDQIELVTSQGISNFIKTLLFKETPIEKALRRMNLSHSDRIEYEAIIGIGGMVLVSGTDPFNEREWTGHTLNKWITNQSNSSNLILWDVKDIRQVPYHQEKKEHFIPEWGVASEFGQGEEVVLTGDIPLKDSQRYVRHPKTKELSIYQAPYEIS